MKNRIIAYILFFLGLLIYIFFWHYNGRSISVISAFALALIGIVIFWVGRRLLRSTPTIRQSKEMDAANQFIKDIKANGDKISVDLNNCEVKENNYTEERLRGGNYGDAIPIDEEQKMDQWTRGNSLYRNNDRVVVQINQTVVTGEVMRFGKPFKFRSQVLRHDRETLLFKMFAQKETTLYIDTKDPDKYYLDMEFLNPH
jgi:hypothetical protein